jgi:hypothetical protein
MSPERTCPLVSSSSPVRSSVNRKRFKYLQLFIYFIVGMSYAQDEQSISSIHNSGIGLGFRQEFNTYLWTANASLDKQLSPRFHFNIFENIRTSMLRITSEGDRWKDDQNLDMKLSYLVSSHWRATAQVKSVVFLDKQSGFNNNVRSHAGIAGFIYTPNSRLSSAVSIGPKWDSRYNQHDQGLTFSLDARAANIDLGGYDNNISFALGEDRYDNRTNSNLRANYRVSRQFTQNAADSLNIFFSNQRRDNYASLMGDIESQREDIKGARNTLFYDVGNGLKMSLATRLEFKNVELLQYGETSGERRRKRHDQRIANDVQMHFNRKYVHGRLALSSWLQEQRYDLDISNSDRPFSARTAFITPDNASSRNLLSTFLSSTISRRDSLSIYASISKYKYDTPDTTNFDDRDELRINTRAVWSHMFDSNLRLEVLAGVNLYHMVYIFGERSADNNWNRIFLLRPTIEYRPVERFKLQQSFEVLANYVDYDFEDPNVPTRSFVFRKFAMTDSLSWKLSRRTLLLFDYRLQLEENGQLYWDTWSEKVIVDRIKQWAHVYWRYSIADFFQLGPGYTVYLRDEWRYNEIIQGAQQREKVGTYISHGPKLRLLYAPGPNIHVVVDATRYKIESAGSKNSFVNNIQLDVRWVF